MKKIYSFILSILFIFAIVCILSICINPINASNSSAHLIIPFDHITKSINITTIVPTKPIRKEEIMPEAIPDNRFVYKKGFFYEPISDDIKEKIYGKSYKTDCTVPYDSLRYVTVLYYNFQHEIVSGEIICNTLIAQDLVEIFYDLYCAQYPIESIRLVDEFDADDELSMEANNSSCFNYRSIAGSSTLSNHALGLAIDINPFYNPYIQKTSSGYHVTPIGSEPYCDRSADFAYKITQDDLCYQLFTAHGFTWGGNWKTNKDYQHFEKK